MSSPFAISHLGEKIIRNAEHPQLPPEGQPKDPVPRVPLAHFLEKIQEQKGGRDVR